MSTDLGREDIAWRAARRIAEHDSEAIVRMAMFATTKRVEQSNPTIVEGNEGGTWEPYVCDAPCHYGDGTIDQRVRVVFHVTRHNGLLDRVVTVWADREGNCSNVFTKFPTNNVAIEVG